MVGVADFAQHRPGAPLRIEIDLKLKGSRVSYAIAFDQPTLFQGAKISDESLAVDGVPIFSRLNGRLQFPNNSDFGIEDHVFALPAIYGGPNNTWEVDFRNFLASMILLSPVPQTMAGYAERPAFGLEADGANFAACLRHMLGQKPAAYGDFGDYLKSVLPDFQSIETLPRGDSATQLVINFAGPKADRNLNLYFDALSDGEKCFFLSAYVVAANRSGTPTVCFWDEPDSHLALPEVGHFITALRKAARPAGQFIATSHHPETVRKFSDDTTLVLTRKSHLDPTVIRPLSDYPYKGDLTNALIRDEIIGAP